MPANKKVPLRKCIVTNEMKPKKELIRVVRNKEGEVFIDETGEENGRGAYLSKNKLALEKARDKDVLTHQFKTKVDSSIYDELLQIVEGVKGE